MELFNKLKNGHILALIIIVALVIQSLLFVVILTEPKVVFLVKRDIIQTVNIQKQNLKSKGLEFGGETVRSLSSAIQSLLTVRPRFCDRCFVTNVLLLFEPKQICGWEPIKLVVFITSLPSQRKDRDVIRKTWLSETRNNNGVRYFFLLGRPVNSSCSKDIQIENDEKNDLVVYDFVDSYQNLTTKTIMGFKYAEQHCSSAKYVMKTDMDVYVNLKAILALLTNGSTFHKNAPMSEGKERSDRGRLEMKNDIHTGSSFVHGEMFGYLRKNSSPLRNDLNKKKWLVTFKEYPNNTYPDYFDGHAYILSMSIAIEVIGISKNIPFFKFEDVYVGICLKELGYTLKATSGFFRDSQHVSVCSHKFEDVYTVHGVTCDRMAQIWNAKCPPKGIVELEYIRPNKQWIKMYIEHEKKNETFAQQGKLEVNGIKFY